MFVLKMYVQIMSLSVLLCNVCVCYVYNLKMSKKIKVKKKIKKTKKSILQITTNMFICRKYVPVHSSFMTYYCICIQRNTMGATSGAGTSYSFGAHDLIPGSQWSSCFSIFTTLCIVLEIGVCLYYFSYCVACPSINGF